MEGQAKHDIKPALMQVIKCKYCHDKDDGWVREDDGYGGIQWTHCVCMPTLPVSDGQPSWEQEWSDFGEVYDDEPQYI